MKNRYLWSLLPTGCAVLGLAAGFAGAAPAPAVAHWEIQVLQDGAQVDDFTGATALGQSDTVTHHHPMTHVVGCRAQPAGAIDLQRTIGVAPLSADAAGVTLELDAQETLEEPGTPTTAEGCALPPQPRQIHAHHPGLAVPAPQSGTWGTWQLLAKGPALAYRIRATLTPPVAP